jgi:hypothetical protein
MKTKSYTNINLEMHVKTEESATNNLTQLPEKIWAQVKRWADENYNEMWYGLQEHQVLELVQKTCKKLGLGNYISAVETDDKHQKAFSSLFRVLPSSRRQEP